MSDVPAVESDQHSLDFTRAQFSEGVPSSMTCAGCNQPLTHEYFQVNGAVTCRGCREAAEAELTRDSALRRFSLATVLGAAAGLVGCTLYWLVGWLSGYEFGLIAIVVGFLVGTAVRFGSSRRGGLPYQFLAVGLTYAAIAGTAIPAVVTELRQRGTAERTAQAVDGAASQMQTASLDGQANAGTTAAELPVFVFAVFVFVIAMALPFLQGFGNIIGIIIIGIGLYEAWKLNTRLRLEVTGPYQVAPAIPGSVGAALT
jgi:hypothetical protein